jgi:hypothetical protein
MPLGAAHDPTILLAEYDAPIVLRVVVRMKCHFPSAQLFLKQRVRLEHLLYGRGSVQVIVLDEVDQLASIVARPGK